MYLIEVTLITLIIISIYSKIETDALFGWINNFFTLNFLSEFGVIFVVYQLIIYTFFTLADSSKVDALIKINSIIKSTLLLISYDKPLDPIKNELEYLLKIKKGHYMFSNKDIEVLEEINTLVNYFEQKETAKKDILLRLEYLKIETEHYKEFHQLSWRNSFLLRIGK